jgi:hypothetical protein
MEQFPYLGILTELGRFFCAALPYARHILNDEDSFLLVKVIFTQLVKHFPAFYGT